jgi:hypothetical protein
MPAYQSPSPAPKKSRVGSVVIKGIIALVVLLAVAAPVIWMTDLKYSVLGAFLTTSAEVSVVDAKTGQPVEGASVSLQGQSAKTNVKGKATFEDLKTGKHQLKVDKESFKTLTRDEVLGAKPPNNLQPAKLEIAYTDVDFYASPAAGAVLKKTSAKDAAAVVTAPYLAKLKQIEFTNPDFYKVEYNDKVGLISKSQVLASELVYEVSELNLRFVKPTAVPDLIHNESKFLGALGVAFSSKSLKDDGFICTYNQAELGALTKDKAPITSFSGDNKPETEIKKLGDFHLYYNAPTGPCGGEDKFGARVTAARNALKAALQSAALY